MLCGAAFDRRTVGWYRVCGCLNIIINLTYIIIRIPREKQV